MAKKMYYTEKEAADKLGIPPAQLADRVRDQKLRVFPDGANKMYLVDEVDALASAGGGEIELAPVEGEGDAVSLREADVAETAAPTKEDTVITSEGISIFDDEDLEIEEADPMAKTQIAPSIEDQITLEGVGSGSGLLDLTRESDDTSLGAEVLDHIDVEGAVGSDLAGQAAAAATYAPEAIAIEAPTFLEVPDASAGLFNGFLIGCAVVAVLMGMVMLAAMAGAVPGYLASFRDSMPVFLIVCVVILAAAAIINWMITKSAVARREAMQRMGG